MFGFVKVLYTTEGVVQSCVRDHRGQFSERLIIERMVLTLKVAGGVMPLLEDHSLGWVIILPGSGGLSGHLAY